MSDIVPWEYRTKTIKQLIKELQSFEEQDLIVMVTSGDGKLFNSVKLVTKSFIPSHDDSNENEQVYCALHI